MGRDRRHGVRRRPRQRETHHRGGLCARRGLKPCAACRCAHRQRFRRPCVRRRRSRDARRHPHSARARAASAIRMRMWRSMRSPTRCSAHWRTGTSARTSRRAIRSGAAPRPTNSSGSSERVAARGGKSRTSTSPSCEAPKIGPHRDALRAQIAEIAGVSIGRVAVKATTSEKLGFTGRGEGIAALASATIRSALERGMIDEETVRRHAACVGLPAQAAEARDGGILHRRTWSRRRSPKSPARPTWSSAASSPIPTMPSTRWWV